MPSGEVYVKVPREISISELDHLINSRAALTEDELLLVLKKHGIEWQPQSDENRDLLEGQIATISPVGGGIDPASVAVLISLQPLINALIPVVTPFAKSAASVAEKIALDLWEHLKEKMWSEKHIALREQRR